MGSAARRRKPAQHRANHAYDVPQGCNSGAACIEHATCAFAFTHSPFSRTFTWTSNLPMVGFCLIRRCHYQAATTTGLQQDVCFCETVLFPVAALASHSRRYPTPVRSISLSVGILDYKTGAKTRKVYRASIVLISLAQALCISMTSR